MQREHLEFAIDEVNEPLETEHQNSDSVKAAYHGINMSTQLTEGCRMSSRLDSMAGMSPAIENDLVEGRNYDLVIENMDENYVGDDNEKIILNKSGHALTGDKKRKRRRVCKTSSCAK